MVPLRGVMPRGMPRLLGSCPAGPDREGSVSYWYCARQVLIEGERETGVIFGQSGVRYWLTFELQKHQNHKVE